MGVYPAEKGNLVIGRVLSPDAYIQAPGYTQSYNRYSYCMNNPLKYMDPE
jgi:RHS repeat-associated protein